MVAKPLRTKPKSASAERCLRSLGATIDMATPDMETSNCPVRGVLSHGGLRKGNQEVAVITGFYRSPGIADRLRSKTIPLFQSIATEAKFILCLIVSRLVCFFTEGCIVPSVYHSYCH